MKSYTIIIKAKSADSKEVKMQLTPVELRGIIKVALETQRRPTMYSPAIFVYNEEGFREA